MIICAIWEIGNEVNGEWTYNHDTETAEAVVQKITAVYDEAKRRNYYSLNSLLWMTMNIMTDAIVMRQRRWENGSRNLVPEKIKNGIDYVFVSYYEMDCDGYKPTLEEWESVSKI